MLQANLAPGFGDVMMLMSRPGNLPVYSHKATKKQILKLKSRTRQRQNLPKVITQEQCLYFLGKRHQRKQLMEEKSPKLQSPMLMITFYQKLAKTEYPPPSTSGFSKRSFTEAATTDIMSQTAKVEALAKTRSTKIWEYLYSVVIF